MAAAANSVSSNPQMTQITKWEDAGQFAGRVVTLKTNFWMFDQTSAWKDTFTLDGLPFAYISKEPQNDYTLGRHPELIGKGYVIYQVLNKNGLVRSDRVISDHRLEKYTLSMKTANKVQQIKIIDAIKSGKAKLDWVPKEEAVEMLESALNDCG